MEAMKKKKGVTEDTDLENVDVTLLPGTDAASISMWKGLLAVVMLLVGFAIGFFRGRASVVKG